MLEGLKSGLDYENIKTIYNLKQPDLNTYIQTVDIYKVSFLKDIDRLEFYVELKDFNLKFKQNLIKNFSYPLLLTFISIVMTILYQLMFLPMVQSIFDISKWVVLFSKVTYAMVVVICFMILCLSVLVFFKEYRFIIYIILHKLQVMYVIKCFMTYRFVFCLNVLHKMYLSTQDAVRSLRKIKKMQDVSWLAYHVDERLGKGMAHIEAFNLNYLEPGFHHFYTIQTFKTQGANFDKYLIFLEKIIENQANKIATTVKLINYFYLILYIALYYLLILQPINMLEVIF